MATNRKNWKISAGYFPPSRKLWTGRLVLLVLPSIRKIIIAARGTSTTTNANKIKSFNMSRVSSNAPYQQPTGQPAMLMFQRLS